MIHPPISGPSEDLEDLYENAPCGYLSLDPSGRIVKSNLTFSTWMDLSQEELVGRKLHELLTVAGRIFYETHFAPLLRMQGFFNEVALDFAKRDGAKLPVLANAVERRDGNGNLLFTRLTVFQALDRRRYERELVDARAAAESARKALAEINAELEEFIAVLGHDLRNPLGSIAGGLELLKRGMAASRAERLIEMMQNSVKRISGLIENVLDFARGRLGHGIPLTLAFGEPLEPLFRQVIGELQVAHPEAAIESTFSITEPVYCDRVRLGQLASNLIANALTHGSPAEPVRVGATTASGTFELWVANAGEPIPEATQARLFQPFFRGEDRGSRQGLGLGLYIASQIAKAHGGSLTVSSSPAETRFTFRMPLEPDPQARQPRPLDVPVA